MLRREIIQAHTRGLPQAGASWRDLPMNEDPEGWTLQLPLAETGYFKAKAYLVDPRGWQHWPSGPDLGISVHPDRYRTGNIIYCAFTRMFGASKTAVDTRQVNREQALVSLDEAGYTVIPPSGKLRDLTRQVPHIIDRLGCRILHLLPVNPTPTTYARFGRFGSPYAAQDLTAIDPALVIFDKRTTGIDQFRELAYETHLRGGRLFLDMVINHTGWGSSLQENHPEWFLKNAQGNFVSPGAWGTIWEDLVELKHQNVTLWDELAEIFLIWCRRGVDGFRCDAGYKVPVAAWQYIIARVQQEFPETLFLLEGLGGAWESTEALLTEGGMQWAYSELFQNYSGPEVATYLEHSNRQSARVGLLVHYSETHDNERLAARGRSWALLRNRLCALTSVSGGYGFTCGVEWLATEKINVHGNPGLAWDSEQNLIPELVRLNQLLNEHPCFFDDVKLTRLSPLDSAVYALDRESAETKDRVLIVVNTDAAHSRVLALDSAATSLTKPGLENWVELLGQPLPEIEEGPGGSLNFKLPPGGAYCLAPTAQPRGLRSQEYRRARSQAAWALTALNQILPIESIGEFNWRSLAAAVERDPAGFLAAISQLETRAPSRNLEEALRKIAEVPAYPRVTIWTLLDVRRITPVPPGHWLLIQDAAPFRAVLNLNDGTQRLHVESIAAHNSHIAYFPPRQSSSDAEFFLERYDQASQQVRASIRFLPPLPLLTQHAPRITDMVLLTNGRGSMARLGIDLGRVQSKYDCVLGANLHPSLPVDRHILAKRIRVWVNADGFISPLDFGNLSSFDAGPPAAWNFVANAGDGRTVEIQMTAEMLFEQNTTVFRFSRPSAAEAAGKQLPANADVRLTVRIDIEDRGFHSETRRNGGADHHFNSNVHTNAPPAKSGFSFTPAADRQLRVFADAGAYHPQPEWSEKIPHPIEQSRGQVGDGDAFSPGWFELPMPKGASVNLVVSAETAVPSAADLGRSEGSSSAPGSEAAFTAQDVFGQKLLHAVRAFVVRREAGKTVIAGYPWFLDWGRDTFICARGLLAAGMLEEVKQVAVTFARFEKDGTMPNTIFGEDASNRDTSDAPLWFGLVCEELVRAQQSALGMQTSGVEEAATGLLPLYRTLVDRSGRTVGDVLQSIALNYIQGTPNRIRMDPASALIWSPSHFTWMDTNYPAGTPREGYPVEIQVLWICLLRQLARIGAPVEGKRWADLAGQALASLEEYFWREDRGYYADVILAGPGRPASQGVVDDALRSNCLLGVSLGLLQGDRAKRCVQTALRYLVVPGALRSLAPLPVSVPLPVYANNGGLLNDPSNPYWGRYEGDEDTRRKPAYHNGTAWTWTFPVFCEALARVWNFSPEAVAAAKAYLGSMERLLAEGCIGQLPEIVDGDAPHTHRGCDAQAWGATEALRVWRVLQRDA
jgi:glycogen debranching enzyme